jgi:hypothetical protein
MGWKYSLNDGQIRYVNCFLLGNIEILVSMAFGIRTVVF